MLTPMLTKPSSLILIAANLTPIAGVLWFDWSVFEILLLYWTESVIIGLINVMRMASCQTGNLLAGFIGARGEVTANQALEAAGSMLPARGIKAFIIPFFMVHYGMFCYGHLTAVVGIFSEGGLNGRLLAAVPTFANYAFWIAVASIFSSHLFSFFANFIGKGEFKRNRSGNTDEAALRPNFRHAPDHHHWGSLRHVAGQSSADAAGARRRKNACRPQTARPRTPQICRRARIAKDSLCRRSAGMIVALDVQRASHVQQTRDSFAGAVAAISGTTIAQQRLVKPERIRRGDKVGLVSPATAAFETQPVEIMREGLEALGLRVELGEHFYNRHGYFAGEDEARASDINTFFRDPETRMIFARGGWGSARILPLLDYDAISANPKVLMGYSDATALINGVHATTGLVTFHGSSPLHRFSAEYFERIVMGGQEATLENLAEIDDDKLVQTDHRVQSIRGGKASGPILGGNLTVLTAILGSGYVPDFDGAILFLEDVGEAVYRVDPMLTQLSLNGILDKLRGFVFGRCTDCGSGTSFGSLTLEEVLAEHIAPLEIPAFSGSMIGHIEQQFTIPLGIDVEMDADAGTIRMLEPGVVVRARPV